MQGEGLLSTGLPRLVLTMALGVRRAMVMGPTIQDVSHPFKLTDNNRLPFNLSQLESRFASVDAKKISRHCSVGPWVWVVLALVLICATICCCKGKIKFLFVCIVQSFFIILKDAMFVSASLGNTILAFCQGGWAGHQPVPISPQLMARELLPGWLPSND